MKFFNGEIVPVAMLMAVGTSMVIAAIVPKKPTKPLIMQYFLCVIIFMVLFSFYSAA